MYRLRNRPVYTPEQLAVVYGQPYDHTKWPDHIQRVAKTIDVGKILYNPGDCIADLTCGDGAIALGISPMACFQLGDFRLKPELREHCAVSGFTGMTLAYDGPIEESLNRLDHEVNLFILSESLEHLDNPDAVLDQIRQVTDRLVLTTPKCSWRDPNPEHYWSWDNETIKTMLTAAGFTPNIYRESLYIDEEGMPLGYTYQIWGCH